MGHRGDAQNGIEAAIVAGSVQGSEGYPGGVSDGGSCGYPNLVPTVLKLLPMRIPGGSTMNLYVLPTRVLGGSIFLLAFDMEVP